MIRHITIPRLGADKVWRDAARGLLASGIPPEAVTWGEAGAPMGLFDQPTDVPAVGDVTVPRAFVAMASTVVWHSDPQRFARLYRFLWRLRRTPGLMEDRADAELAILRRLEKNVHRCQHKMKAFVRFREIGAPDAPRRSFAAWFEPTHHTVEPTAGFFVRRFADMDWRIVTPDVSAIFEGGALRYALDQPQPDLPPDAGEDLWITYFRNIFNPARLKVQAMQSEMPKKYWKNLPEAASIPQMITEAPARARQMALNAPSLPPPRMERVQAMQMRATPVGSGSADGLADQIRACTRCSLHCNATQAVPGEGPSAARLMIVGEQPGDQEDLAGRPFVGPAGQLLDRIAQSVGLDRKASYATNAVKHFKFLPRGKRRLHQTPDRLEVEACLWWLNAEIEAVKPHLILALGATAAAALTGSSAPLGPRRGMMEPGPRKIPVLITCHPSYLLRLPDGEVRVREMAAFADDLSRTMRLVSALAPG